MIAPARRDRGSRRRTLTALGVAGLCLLFARNTQDAIANGDTRALDLYHAHTHESLRVTFRRNGSFDSAALEKLNWFLRDWRKDEPTSMAPGLFDIVWYAYRESGASEPVKVVSAYRSPGTNEMLRRRSRAVAKDSQHTRGNAMDFHIPGVSMAKVREIAMRLQRGGVGYYPTAGSPFVHLDVGTVRSWPRMGRDQLSRLFPDGKTVHLPADGIPLENYHLALAEVQARGGNALDLDTINSNRGKSLWALLFGGEGDDDRVEEARSRVAARNPRGRGGQRPSEQVASRPTPSSDSVMQVAIAPVEAPLPLPARTRRPAPAEAVIRPVPDAEPAAAAPKPEPIAPEPVAAAVLQVASLPVPPIRPRGAQLEALIAAIEPLPPIRPQELKAAPPVAIATLTPSEVAPLPEPAPVAVRGLPLPPVRIALAPVIETPPAPQEPKLDEPKLDEPKLAAGIPLPPLRPAIASEPAALALASPPPAAASALPGIVRTPEPSPLAQAYALVAAPQPPARAVAPKAEPAPLPRTAALPAPVIAPAKNPMPVRRASEPEAKTDKRVLTASEPAAQRRPDYVVQVSEPPVEREIKSAVVAMPLAQQQPAPSSLGFAGSFIRPLGARFTRLGE